MCAKFKGRPDWVQGKEVLMNVFELDGDPGYLDLLGKGFTYSALVCELDLNGESTVVVVRIPRHEARDAQVECARREFALLEQLDERIDGAVLDVPRPFGLSPTDHGLAMVESFIPGMTLDSRAGQALARQPCSFAGRVAAAIHNLNPNPYIDILDGFETQRGHAENGWFSTFERENSDEFQRAREYVANHLPENRPARLLHGNLLDHSIKIEMGDINANPEDSLGVVDWEVAMFGSRRRRRPFPSPV